MLLNFLGVIWGRSGVFLNDLGTLWEDLWWFWDIIGRPGVMNVTRDGGDAEEAEEILLLHIGEGGEEILGGPL